MIRTQKSGKEKIEKSSHTSSATSTDPISLILLPLPPKFSHPYQTSCASRPLLPSRQNLLPPIHETLPLAVAAPGTPSTLIPSILAHPPLPQFFGSVEGRWCMVVPKQLLHHLYIFLVVCFYFFFEDSHKKFLNYIHIIIYEFLSICKFNIIYKFYIEIYYIQILHMNFTYKFITYGSKYVCNLCNYLLILHTNLNPYVITKGFYRR